MYHRNSAQDLIHTRCIFPSLGPGATLTPSRKHALLLRCVRRITGGMDEFLHWSPEFGFAEQE